MRGFSKRIYHNASIHFRRIAFEGFGLTVVLVMMLVLIISSTYKSLVDDQENLNSFVKEKTSLEEYQKKNEELSETLTIVESEEYKKLLARDILGLAESNQQLYRRSEDLEFYEVQVELLDVKEMDDYSSMWNDLLD
jgi:hypothetical protein